MSDSRDGVASLREPRLLQHFDRLIEAPDAIPRLRQLIYQLGVRGKLVEQEPTDRRKPRAASVAVTPQAIPFELPRGWRWATIAELGRLHGGGTPPKTREDYWAGPIPWVSPKDMKRDCIMSAQLAITEEAVANSAAKLVQAGTILFVVRGMILAHSFPVAMAGAPVAINQDMKALVLRQPEMAEYVLRALKGLTPEMLRNVKRSTHGTCRLEREDYADFLLPIPPLAEQHQIVRKIDELMSLCDRLEVQLSISTTARCRLLESVLRGALQDD